MRERLQGQFFISNTFALACFIPDRYPLFIRFSLMILETLGRLCDGCLRDPRDRRKFISGFRDRIMVLYLDFFRRVLALIM